MKCNNCDLVLPVEEMRIPIQSLRGDLRLHYPGRMNEPMLYMEMLLCSGCRTLFRVWNERWSCLPGRPK